MIFLNRIRRKRAAFCRHQSVRPVLECLEDRCLLSGGFLQINLASDLPGLAAETDPNLVNPWGIAFSRTGPFWVTDNGTGVSDIVDGNGKPFSLAGNIPSAVLTGDAPTGVVFNGGPGFVLSQDGVVAPSRFLFANEDGRIFGWSAVVDPSGALLALDNSITGADYTGLALAADPAGHSFLFAADFSHDTIAIFDQAFRPVQRPGAFQDPNLPAGFAPFNIQNIDNRLFVTYAQRNGRDSIAGAGLGFIDVYNTNGNLVSRFASNGALNAPWGLALAPADFGPFGGALLVANNGDGHINAFNPVNGAFLGELADGNGSAIAVSNLWALTFGNDHAGGDSHTLFFTAGVGDEAHGLFGALQAPGRQGANTAGSGAFDPTAPGEPGDYPLPPRDGPVPAAGSDNQTFPTIDLLPLSEFSLAMAPTLSTIPQPGIVPGARTVGVVSFFGSVPSPDSNPSIPSVGNEVVALDTFPDLNAAPMFVHKVGVQQLGADPPANLPSTDHEAGAESLVSAMFFQDFETQVSPEQEIMAPSGQAAQRLAEIPPESGIQSAEDRDGSNKPADTQNDLGGIYQMKLLFIACLPMILTYWVRTGPRPGDGEG